MKHAAYFVFSIWILTTSQSAATDDVPDCDQVLNWCETHPDANIEAIQVGKYYWASDIYYVQDYRAGEITDVYTKPRPGDNLAPKDPKAEFAPFPSGSLFFYLYQGQQFYGLLNLEK